jgi:hypothetical protein
LQALFFLVKLLIGLGLDSGGALEIFREKRGAIRDPDFVWPEVVKGTGMLCHKLNDKAKKYGWDIEHVFLCVRRREPMTRSQSKMKKGGGVYKKLTSKQFNDRLKWEIPHTLGNALLEILENDYPYTIIEFPRSARDVKYCYSMIHPVLPVDVDLFEDTWRGVVDVEKIRFG